MLKKAPLLIVSAFGRGHVLAQTLKAHGVELSLLDVTSEMGDMKPEDNEGPFGVFKQGLTPSESQRLLHDQPSWSVENGWTLVTPEGPLEVKGPLASYRRNSLGISERVWPWVADGESLGANELQWALAAPFDQTWFFHLARSFHSNQWRPNYRAGLDEQGLPMGSDFVVRAVDRRSHDQAIESLQREGIELRSGVQVVDVSNLGRGQLGSLEFRSKGSPTAEVIEFERLIWCLTGEETERMSDRLVEKLFPQGIQRPIYSWLRARIRIPRCPQREVLPVHSVWVNDVALPWSHENLLILQRSSHEEFFDLWFRIPEVYRFLKDMVLDIVATSVQRLESGLGVRGVEVSEAPLSALMDSNQIGASRFPIFEKRDLVANSGPQNVDCLSPETVEGLGLNHLVLGSRKLGEKVIRWWTEREKLKEKEQRLSSRGSSQ